MIGVSKDAVVSWGDGAESGVGQLCTEDCPVDLGGRADAAAGVGVRNPARPCATALRFDPLSIQHRPKGGGRPVLCWL